MGQGWYGTSLKQPGRQLWFKRLRLEFCQSDLASFSVRNAPGPAWQTHL